MSVGKKKDARRSRNRVRGEKRATLERQLKEQRELGARYFAVRRRFERAAVEMAAAAQDVLLLEHLTPGARKNALGYIRGGLGWTAPTDSKAPIGATLGWGSATTHEAWDDAFDEWLGKTWVDEAGVEHPEYLKVSDKVRASVLGVSERTIRNRRRAAAPSEALARRLLGQLPTGKALSLADLAELMPVPRPSALAVDHAMRWLWLARLVECGTNSKGRVTSVRLTRTGAALRGE